ncbi:kinase-like protein [Schizopora paradoxa]|uniref:Kinase-like protein n=1 Tax=Schizopora paradoxa TaxID=27342 RepID=A0A0H2R293_9AGAM|nr:kinase-like protein [Schizopora paradoxa]
MSIIECLVDTTQWTMAPSDIGCSYAYDAPQLTTSFFGFDQIHSVGKQHFGEDFLNDAEPDVLGWEVAMCFLVNMICFRYLEASVVRNSLSSGATYDEESLELESNQLQVIVQLSNFKEQLIREYYARRTLIQGANTQSTLEQIEQFLSLITVKDEWDLLKKKFSGGRSVRPVAPARGPFDNLCETLHRDYVCRIVDELDNPSDNVDIYDILKNIRLFYETSISIINIYHFYHLLRAASKSKDDLSALISSERHLLQTVVDQLDDYGKRVQECSDSNIHSKIGYLHRKILFAIGRARGIVPASFFVAKGVQLVETYPIGRGGFADVWKGRFKLLGTGKLIHADAHPDLFALKILRPKSFTRSETELMKHSDHLRAALCREAVLWKAANHPNVLQFTGLCRLQELGSSIALVSPWMRHGHLLNYVQHNCDANRSCMLAQTARGLLYLHSIGIIHGDLKCSNIMVDDNGLAKISDFGLGTIESVRVATSASSSSSGGNPRWLAPELMSGPGKSTCESDVYAFGMTALELFTEKVPFPDVYTASLPYAIAIAGLEPSWPGPEAEARGLTSKMWKLMKKCWSRNPSLRTRTLLSDILDLTFDSLGTFALTRLGQPQHDLENLNAETSACELAYGKLMAISKSRAQVGWFSNVWHATLKRWRKNNIMSDIDVSIKVRNTTGVDVYHICRRTYRTNKEIQERGQYRSVYWNVQLQLVDCITHL